jgi:hypothetical protein
LNHISQYDKEDLEGINHSMYSTELKDGFQKGKTTPTPNEKNSNLH